MTTTEVVLQPETAICAIANTSFVEISRHSAAQLDYTVFYWKYMKNNWPVIITNVSSEWECRRNWIRKFDDNSTVTNDNRHTAVTAAINFDYLRHKIGECRVPVADCTTEYFNSHAKREMQFFDFLAYWQDKIEANNSNATNANTNITPIKNLYLKDWHLKAMLPNYEFYRVPKQFASDWLNEQLINTGRDDYRFVYMGPKDSWTPFHADVFGSYSWSTNITGCKKWILLPPSEELKLSDQLGNLPIDVDEQLLEANNVRFFSLLQKENEALFVPSGWYHQVWNLTDTISVNHNWFNACNILHIWRNLSSNMKQVIAEIEDCRQMDNFKEHCQTMLRASFGINYLDFLELLEYIAARRLASCNNDTTTKERSSKLLLLFDTFTPNEFHIYHDLQSIHSVLKTMLQDAVVWDSPANLTQRCLHLLEQTSNFGTSMQI